MKMSGQDIQEIIKEINTTLNNIELFQQLDINEKARIADKAKLPISLSSFMDILHGHELVLRTILQEAINKIEIEV